MSGSELDQVIYYSEVRMEWSRETFCFSWFLSLCKMVPRVIHPFHLLFPGHNIPKNLSLTMINKSIVRLLHFWLIVTMCCCVGNSPSLYCLLSFLSVVVFTHILQSTYLYVSIYLYVYLIMFLCGSISIYVHFN